MGHFGLIISICRFGDGWFGLEEGGDSACVEGAEMAGFWQIFDYIWGVVLVELGRRILGFVRDVFFIGFRSLVISTRSDDGVLQRLRAAGG